LRICRVSEGLNLDRLVWISTPTNEPIHQLTPFRRRVKIIPEGNAIAAFKLKAIPSDGVCCARAVTILFKPRHTKQVLLPSGILLLRQATALEVVGVLSHGSLKLVTQILALVLADLLGLLAESLESGDTTLGDSTSKSGAF
jgi:hypothetical protein